MFAFILAASFKIKMEAFYKMHAPGPLFAFREMQKQKAVIYLWRYRELMYFLAWRDLLVRYKQTIIGVAWALIRPALTMVVFVVFRRMFGVEPGSVPEPILVFAAVLPWQFFSTALSESSGSLNQSMPS